MRNPNISIKKEKEPKKLVKREVKQKGYYRNIIKNGKITGRTYVHATKVDRWVVSDEWKEWRIREINRLARVEYNRILREQIKRWWTGWERSEFRDRNTGYKFYYRDVLTFRQFVAMRKREERIDRLSKYKKKLRIKFISDERAIREARKLLEIAKWKSERIKMSPEFDKWLRGYIPSGGDKRRLIFKDQNIYSTDIYK